MAAGLAFRLVLQRLPQKAQPQLVAVQRQLVAAQRLREALLLPQKVPQREDQLPEPPELHGFLLLGG